MIPYQIAGFWALAAVAAELRRSGVLLQGTRSAKEFHGAADDWAAVAAYRHAMGGWGHE